MRDKILRTDIFRGQRDFEIENAKSEDVMIIGSMSTTCRLGKSMSRSGSPVLLVCRGYLNNTKLDKVIDTGAQVSCVSKKVWERLGKPLLRPVTCVWKQQKDM